MECPSTFHASDLNLYKVVITAVNLLSLWSNHINLIASKSGKSIGILYKVRYIRNKLSCLQLYRSLIEPYLNYCCLIWGSNKMNVHLNQLYKLQKKSICLITFSDYTAHSQPIIYRLNVLNIYDLFKLQLYTFIYRVLFLNL